MAACPSRKPVGILASFVLYATISPLSTGARDCPEGAIIAHLMAACPLSNTFGPFGAGPHFADFLGSFLSETFFILFQFIGKHPSHISYT